MKAEDEDAFAAYITQVLGFYRQDASDFALSVWWEACKGFDLEQVIKALTAHATHPEKGQFPPKPADIVRELGGTFTDRALLAWSRVTRVASEIGAYASVDFGDPVIHEAISQLGGWAAFCRAPLDEMPFLQKRFCDFHRTFTTRGAPADAPLQLQGEHAQVNAAKALESPEVAKRLSGVPAGVRRIG